jgi:hypothetical protein
MWFAGFYPVFLDFLHCLVLKKKATFFFLTGAIPLCFAIIQLIYSVNNTIYIGNQY